MMHWRTCSLLFLIMLLALSVGGCGNLTFTVGVSSSSQELTSTVVDEEPGDGGNEVAVIDVSGLIINGPKPALLRQGENPVALLHEKLRKAEKDDDVKAVILRINSPGGTVTATDIMFREVERFKQRTGKPVVALMMDVAASGGYYLACSADHVVAYPSTVTGSIGVIIQTITFKEAMNRVGIRADAITSGPNKAAGSPLGELTPEHRAILKGLVDDFYGRFTTVVRTNRPSISPSHFAEVTDGRVVSGTDAAELGLVDQVGDLYDAFAKAKELAGVPRAKMVLYHRPLNYVASPFAAAPGVGGAAQAGAGGTQINLFQLNLHELPGGADVGFYYLWQPMGP